MSTIQLTSTQHAILARAIHFSDGKIEWFPDNVKGGARKKVLDGMFNRALITTDGTDWFVAAEGYDALGMKRPTTPTVAPQGAPVQDLDQRPKNDPEDDFSHLDDPYDRAVAAAKMGAMIRKNQEKAIDKLAHGNSKQAEVIRMLQRPEGATISQICAVTGWQPHTVRGTFAGVFKKKLGLTLVSEQRGGERVYRLV